MENTTGALRARTFESRLSALGVHGLEIEVGPVGFVIYGPSFSEVARGAALVAAWARLIDTSVRLDRVAVDVDEPAETRFVTTVHFAWDLVQSRAA